MKISHIKQKIQDIQENQSGRKCAIWRSTLILLGLNLHPQGNLE